MNTTLFKKVDYTLSKLIHDIDHGEIGLPDIQRPFVWEAAKVRDLFDSMYKGFPVGYLLFWANALASSSRVIGIEGKQAIPHLLIVDGQQRLTSLYAVLKGRPVLDKDYKERRIQIAFRPTDASFEVADAAIRRNPEYIPDISALWAGEVSRNRFVRQFIDRLKASREVDDDEEDYLIETIDRLYDLHNYPFTVLELSASVDEEQVADVFVRINSQGVTLKQADFILTLMSVYWEEGRKQLERFCHDSRRPANGVPSPHNHFVEPDPDQLLRVAVGLGFRRARLKFVYSILRGKDLETEEFSDELREQQFDVLKGAQGYTLDLLNWHEYLKALIRAGFRNGGMVTSKTTLFYCYTMYLIGRRDYRVDHYQLGNLIAAWFFMCALTRRYTSSPETIMEGDLARLRTTATASEFVEVLTRIMRDALTEDYWNITLPNELESSSAFSPALSAYHASLNMQGARALFSELRVADLMDPALIANRSHVERHHLFPRAYLKEIGIVDQKIINQIANFAYVEWADNIQISDTSPAVYFPRFAERCEPDELQQMMRWHALPDDWHTMEYTDFLEARRKQMAQVIRSGYEHLAGRLREWTVQVNTPGV
ncbi:MAG TPA: DUF262 domain-containing protein [Rhodothermales bacterium]|nr:DUF262 domain-containing protein [Rhodothermales bacterium]